MKKLALGALFVGLVAACGGGKDKPVLIDAPGGGDDAPVTVTCNPVTQTGCAAGERCTDVTLQDMPQRVTSIQCVADGTVDIGGACTLGTPGPSGFDNCKAGGICVDSECKATCDPQMAGVASGCDAQHSCSRYNGLFTVGGMILYGACDPQCDPLTQRLLVGTPNEACGSTAPAMPTKGCYRTGDPFETFSCAGAGPAANTDRQIPETDDGTPAGNAFINGCAPGFMPLFFESGTVQETRCSGSCAPGEIDNGSALHIANAPGVAATPVKLQDKPAPVAGDGLCVTGKKGSGAAGSENCLFIWPFITDAQGNPGPSTYNETLGFCFAFAQFQYDSDGDGQITAADKKVPDCKTLPPRSAATPAIDDDAADFGCQLIANSAFASTGKPQASAIKDVVRIGNGPGEAVRHIIK